MDEEYDVIVLGMGLKECIVIYAVKLPNYVALEMIEYLRKTLLV